MGAREVRRRLAHKHFCNTLGSRARSGPTPRPLLTTPGLSIWPRSPCQAVLGPLPSFPS